MKVSEPKLWFTSKSVIAVVAALIGFLGGTAFDQVIRNRIDEHMYKYMLRELLPTGFDDYKTMSLHWQQVISELSVRRKIIDDTESRVLFATLEHFDVKRLRLVDKIVPYMIFDFVVRDPSRRETQHPIPNMVYADFLDLESLGVLQSVAQGTLIQRKITTDGYVIETGTHTVTIRPGRKATTLRFTTTRISEPWVKLIRLARVPTDERYLKWFSTKIRNFGFHVEVTRKNQ